MYKIVLDARRLRLTTGRYHRELLTHLEHIDTENEYHVIIQPDDQTFWTPTNKNFYMHVVEYDSYTFGEQLGLARTIYRLKPDLVHFLMPQQPLLYLGKRITSIHDLTLLRFDNVDKNKYVYALDKFIFRMLLKNVAKRSKRVFTLTKYVKNDLLDFVRIPSQKIIVARPAASPLDGTKPHPVETLKNKRFITYVGQAFTHKNLYALAEAFEKLADKHPDLHLVYVGKMSEFHEQLQKQVAHVPNIHFTGFISDAQLAWIYKHAEAYVFPSLSEGFGLPALEAMQHDLPVVSSDATCLPEVYGDAAHYFDATSTDDMARAIDEVLRSKSRREHLIKAGREQVKKYSWEKLAQTAHKNYMEVLEPKR